MTELDHTLELRILKLQQLTRQLAEQQQLLAENQRQLVQMCLDLQQQIRQIQVEAEEPRHDRYH